MSAEVIKTLSWATDSLFVIRRIAVLRKLVNDCRHKKTSKVEAMEGDA
jgi:hypothetical protein